MVLAIGHLDHWTGPGIGFLAGLFGGLLGVGGSTLIIPGLTLIFGYNQHLFQAAAMIVNVVICVPAAVRHYQAGAMVPTVLGWMVPWAVLFVMGGVWMSNQSVFHGAEGGLWLGRVLAIFLVYVILVNVRRLWQPEGPDGSIPIAVGQSMREGDQKSPMARSETTPVSQPSRAAIVGMVMGAVAGLLGIGGGAVSVPLQQLMLRLPLRCCIANSSAVICFSAVLGAWYKNMSLDTHHWHWQASAVLALLLAPSAWLGGHWGAGWTHRLPVRHVRLAFIGLMVNGLPSRWRPFFSSTYEWPEYIIIHDIVNICVNNHSGDKGSEYQGCAFQPEDGRRRHENCR